MAIVRVYSTRWCGYCVRAKALLDSRGIEYEEVSLDEDPAFRQKLFDLTGGWTVPQILIDDQPIGGFTELWGVDPGGRVPRGGGGQKRRKAGVPRPPRSTTRPGAIG